MKKLLLILIISGCATAQTPNMNYNCTEVVHKAIISKKCQPVFGLRNKYAHAWMECNRKTVDLLGNEPDYTYTPILKGQKVLELMEIEYKYHQMGYDATIIYNNIDFIVIYKTQGTEGWRIHK